MLAVHGDGTTTGLHVVYDVVMEKRLEDSAMQQLAEKRLAVAYLGPPGTFSEEAVARCSEVAGWDARPFSTIVQAYEAARTGDVTVAMLPIENSHEGSVTPTLDSLLHRGGLLIRAELVLPVKHCLMALPGTEPAQVQGIVSHPQALGQCAAFLEREFAGVPQEAAHSTADAARIVAGRPGWAAIAPRRAAAVYGLAVLQDGIQDSTDNFTRFVLLGQTDAPPTGRDRTSIVFGLDRDRPGGLAEVMTEFGSRDINLSKIESRPARSGPWQYVFFLDIEAHRTDPACAAALEAVRQASGFYRLLGSYPRTTGDGR